MRKFKKVQSVLLTIAFVFSFISIDYSNVYAKGSSGGHSSSSYSSSSSRSSSSSSSSKSSGFSSKSSSSSSKSSSSKSSSSKSSSSNSKKSSSNSSGTSDFRSGSYSSSGSKSSSSSKTSSSSSSFSSKTYRPSSSSKAYNSKIKVESRTFTRYHISSYSSCYSVSNNYYYYNTGGWDSFWSHYWFYRCMDSSQVHMTYIDDNGFVKSAPAYTGFMSILWDLISGLVIITMIIFIIYKLRKRRW